MPLQMRCDINYFPDVFDNDDEISKINTISRHWWMIDKQWKKVQASRCCTADVACISLWISCTTTKNSPACSFFHCLTITMNLTLKLATPLGSFYWVQLGVWCSNAALCAVSVINDHSECNYTTSAVTNFLSVWLRVSFIVSVTAIFLLTTWPIRQRK